MLAVQLEIKEQENTLALIFKLTHYRKDCSVLA